MDQESDFYFPVYLSLVALTLLTLGSFYFQLGRIFAITIALTIATVKASLIGLYFMHLQHEKPLIYGIVAVGAVAVAILTIGILPDIALKL
jgi:cytochrome c oxidase subunit 4